MTMRIALVAATFSLVVCALLLYDFERRAMKDPFEAKAMLALKVALKEQPGSEVLKEEIRAMDERLREEYFRQKAFAAVGAALLAAGVVVFLIAVKSAAVLRRRLPMPQPFSAPQDFDSQWTPVARWAVAAMVVLLAAVSIVLSLGLRSPLPEEAVETAASQSPVATDPGGSGSSQAVTPAAAKPPVTPAAKPTVTSAAKPSPAPSAQAAAAASEEEIRSAWPRFRGADGSGISRFTDVPDSWDGPSGKNILWKTPAGLPGNGSVVVCGKRAFLSGADEKHRQVCCFDTTSGAMLWKQDAPSTPQSLKPIKVNGDTGFASCTVATDGRFVAAVFANGDLAAFDYSGKLAWSQSLGIPDNAYGHAASLALYKDLLLVPMDQGTMTANRSKLVALNMATGKVVWQKIRPVGSSWTTPIVIQHAGRDQIITTANPWVIAYDPKDGAELWRAKCLQGDVAPSPVYADGVVYATANDSAPLCAIKVDGKGDVTATHILWKGEDNVPDTCSPVATEKFVFLLTSAGMVTGYDAKKGDKLWEEDLGNLKFKSSLSLVGSRLYLIDEDGKGVILEPGPDKCKKVGEMNLGEACVTCPAFQDGRIYLRGEKNLFCIGKPHAQGKP